VKESIFSGVSVTFPQSCHGLIFVDIVLPSFVQGHTPSQSTHVTTAAAISLVMRWRQHVVWSSAQHKFLMGSCLSPHLSMCART